MPEDTAKPVTNGEAQVNRFPLSFELSKTKAAAKTRQACKFATDADRQM